MSFKAAKPDARILIFQIIMTAILSFSLNNLVAVLLLCLSINLIVFIQLGTRICLKNLVQLFFLVVFLQVIVYFQIPVISTIFPIFILLLLKVFPIQMLIVLFVKKIPMNELLFSLEVIRVPKFFLIPLAVVYRYIPTIKTEFVYINENLEMRGLNANFFRLMRHPIQTLESYLVPLLSRSEKIAEELAASSVSKGLSTRGKRTCCMSVKLNFRDVLYFCLIIILAVICIHVDKI